MNHSHSHETERSLRALLDKQEIRDAISRYCRGVDRFDWDLAASVYHPDGIDLHGVFNGHGREFIEFLRGFMPGFAESSQHIALNSLIELEGERAYAETYHLGWHRRASGDLTAVDLPLAARMVDRLERRGGRWAIASRRFVFDWGRIDLVPEEFPLPEGSIPGRRGDADPSHTNFQRIAGGRGGVMKDTTESLRPDALELLVAKDEIRDVIIRSARAIDRFDWELARSCYHHDAVDRHGIYNGSVDGFIKFSQEWLQNWTESTTHFLGNCLIEIDGTEAAAETYILGYHRGVPPGHQMRADMIVAGRYVDRFERRAGFWKIVERTFVFDWSRIDPVGEVFEPPPSTIMPARDRSDPSYR